MLWHTIQGAGGLVSAGGGDLSLTFRASEGAEDGSPTIPASTQVGDLLIYFENLNGTTGDNGTPTGFTRLDFFSGSSNANLVAYRIAQSGDAGSSVTATNPSNNWVMISAFEPSSSISSVTGNDVENTSLSSSQSTSHTVNASGSSSNAFVLACLRSNNNADTMYSSPAEDGVATITGVDIATLYKSYGSSPSDVVVYTPSAGGNRTIFTTMYLTLT